MLILRINSVLNVLTSPLGFFSTPGLNDPNAPGTPRGCKNNLLGVLYHGHWLRFWPEIDKMVVWILYDQGRINFFSQRSTENIFFFPTYIKKKNKVITVTKRWFFSSCTYEPEFDNTDQYKLILSLIDFEIVWDQSFDCDRPFGQPWSIKLFC